MNLHLSGKTALVGGASQGIGYAIAHLLAAEGAKVAMMARRRPKLDAAADRIRQETKSEAIAVQGDSRSAADCARFVETALATFGQIDIAVNNDGAPPLGDLTSFDDEAWSKAIEQNLMYVVRMSRAVAPIMRRQKSGSIVNIAALSALQPEPGFGLSVATWAGVIGFAKTLSLELAPDNINVNTICPGYTETSRLEKVFTAHGGDPEERRELLKSEVPMGRIGTADDVAALVAFLASSRGRYITGSAIHVDGGLFKGLH
jgi:3-oxoacyl-[acyl-carrier protein] reductase